MSAATALERPAALTAAAVAVPAITEEGPAAGAPVMCARVVQVCGTGLSFRAAEAAQVRPLTLAAALAAGAVKKPAAPEARVAAPLALGAVERAARSATSAKA